MRLKFKQFQLKKIDTPHFIMSPIELKDYLDFEVKRVYFISQPRSKTGGHCHKLEREFFVMVKGECTAVIDHGEGLKEYKMKGPTSAMYIDNFVWHHFKNFSKDAVLLALSSTNYNPNRADYIEDYDEYKKVTF